MKIYTRTGDRGTTALVGGSRTSKDDIRVEAYGTVDELMAHIGYLHDLLGQHDTEDVAISVRLQGELEVILDRLMVCAALLASDSEVSKRVPQITSEDVLWLEAKTDLSLDGLPELRNFTLPCGHVLLSYSHICRTVCRRAERRAVSASAQFTIDQHVGSYLNRLSDYLYALGRRVGHDFGAREVCWIP